MPKLKVYGGLKMVSGGRQARFIVATTSQKKAAEITGLGLPYIRGFWCVTGIAAEIEAAMPDKAETDRESAIWVAAREEPTMFRKGKDKS